MKTLAALVAFLVAVGLMQAQSPAPAPAAKPAAPGAAVKTPAKKEVKKEEKKEAEPKIPGTTIVRTNGKFLGLEIVGGQFKLSFYDAKKKPAAVDVTRATARWPNPRGPGDYRTVLNPSGKALVGSKPVTPPYTFNVYLTLLQGDGDEAKAVETYVVQPR
ncbi:MAG: hypothetical protein PSV13_02145 [Lacunisphaera sp.]|nr:hypothetical protein [Lacunisphaera sp.]